MAAEKNDGLEPANHDAANTGNDQPVGAVASTEATTALLPAKNDTAGRKRKRHLLNSIRAQMEFYFGDANLSKDRFLRRYVEQDPYVPLDIFLTFNKIKTLTQDVQQISTSLSNSQLLELDESGLKVRRKTELPKQRDVNDKTLYVEALPATATHDWLKEVFSRYGPVSYVSLPHYPGTRKIKEFAFIEFEKSGSVEKAIKAFAQVQGVLSVEHTDPADLASIRSFQQQPQMTSSSTDVGTESNVRIKQAIKRESDKDALQETVAAKRIKLEPLQEPSEASGVETTDAETSQQSDTDNKKDDNSKAEGTKEKKRRRKQKKRIMADKLKPNITPNAMELKILPKSSWCSLRNKYLNLQRRMISEAKSKLWRSSQAKQPSQKCTAMQHQQLQAQQQQLVESKGSCNSGTSSGHEDPEPLSDAGEAAEVPVPSKRRKRNKNAGVHKMNMNFYGAGGSEADDSKMTGKAEDAAQERSPLFKYEPGLIVECTLQEPCVNVKDFKTDMRQYTDIKYVDIKEGDQVAHLRLVTPTAAEDLARQLSCAEMQFKVLRGQSESQYWRKIEEDREAKLSKKVRVQQKRGREKVAKLLAKHIKFDDADDETLIVSGGANVNDPVSSVIISTDI
ncbi:la-related protein 7 [Drosophila grimshawi]|uniref:La-related protein 7 n=1 Tax=Drosophila grimshawi TaxID=7222 RepID=B4JKN2_DROGR|nr:la-related protein 7 [Drosophila grimshawi]EDW00135.1 GH12028 [Drosophila grimshawi]